MIDIENEIYTTIKTTITSASVEKDSPEVINQQPIIVFSQEENTSYEETVDSSGEQHNDLDFKIEIYTQGDSKRSVSKSLQQSIDAIMSGTYNMRRIFSQEVPNFMDRRIYRYILKYSCVVDKNGKIYRR